VGWQPWQRQWRYKARTLHGERGDICSSESWSGSSATELRFSGLFMLFIFIVRVVRTDTHYHS
jgi:hypothetical protein